MHYDAEMPRCAAAAEGLHLAALGAWLGAIVVSGAAAAIIFPTMRSLDPRMPEFGSYQGPHWMIAGPICTMPLALKMPVERYLAMTCV